MYSKYLCRRSRDQQCKSDTVSRKTDAIWTRVGSHFAPAPMDEKTLKRAISDVSGGRGETQPLIRCYDNAPATRSCPPPSNQPHPYINDQRKGPTLVLILSIASTTQFAPSSHPSLSVPFRQRPTLVSILPGSHHTRQPSFRTK